jgi:FSR family fosmidomycin resistance protein-like MFS transporter
MVLPLSVAAVTHAAVDAACAVLLFGGVAAGHISSAGVMSAFLAYGLLAFGTQPIIGLVADRSRSYRRAAVAGTVATALAPLVALAPGGIVPAIIMAGLGNATFHVGAGAFSLRATPGKALAPGLFVAPGAAGLALGTVAGRAGAALWPFVLVLAALAPLLAAMMVRPAVREALAVPGPSTPVVPRAENLLLLVLLVVTARSFVGSAVVFPWRTAPWMLVALTGAVVVGKALGGALADRYGRIAVGATTLLVAGPLLVLGVGSPLAGIAGMLAFNVTMPITLVAVADAMPEYPGSAFGLTCVALIVGAFPALVGMPVTSLPPLVVSVVVVSSAAVLVFALARLRARSTLGSSGSITAVEGSAS